MTFEPAEQVDAVRAAVLDAYRRAGLPASVHLDVTYRCDLDCQHCYLDDRTRWPELNTAELERLLYELKDFGVLSLRWSGGEVFQRPDFLGLVALAGRLGFSSRIKTHGGNLTPERVAALPPAGVERVDVSVYSLDAAIHDAFTRRPGSLAATLAGVELLRAAGIAVQVSVTVLPATIDEIARLHAYFTERGCSVQLSTRIFRDHSASDRLDALQLTLDEKVRAEAEIRRLTAPRPGQPPRLGQKGPVPCNAGRLSAYVSPDGGVWPCVAWPMALGNVREQPFARIWRESPLRQQIAAWTNADRTACHSCGGSGFCSYCPGEAFKLTGDYREAPASFHGDARARMRAYEVATGDVVPAAQWQATPAGEALPAPPRRFVFPIYRKQRGAGRRVGGTSP